MIVLILKTSLVISLFCVGLFLSASRDGDILNPVRNFLEDHLTEWLFKPLIGCVKCMASVWSIFLYGSYVIFYNQEYELLILLVIIIPIVSAMNLIIAKIIEYLTFNSI